MRLALSLSSPAVDLFDIETPIASDLERWQLSGLEQAINGAWVHFKIFGELLHGDYRGNIIRRSFHVLPCSFDAELREQIHSSADFFLSSSLVGAKGNLWGSATRISGAAGCKLNHSRSPLRI